MRKYDVERDVTGARADRASVGDCEQSREPRAIISSRREWWPSEGIVFAHLQGTELACGFEPGSGERIGGNDKGGFGALWGCSNANAQANIATR